ncbi:hypothetical protein GGU11DRAFT_749005 [Lentinula aff. detonsa]|nr:hypothetical protein GGU11DRAFT_749005 [Lentinula aff. detonsa]
MSLPPSYRHRLLHAFGPPLGSVGPIRSSTPRPACRPSPYPSSPASSAHPHLDSSDDEFETYCFNDVCVLDSDDEQEQTPQTPSKKVRFQPSRGTPPCTSGTSNSQDEDTDEENDGKIAKLKGEVGRPNQGGYNLRITLGWEDARYEKVKTFINDLVDNNLDGRVPMSEQALVNVQTVREKAIAKFSFLEEYREHWVVNDFIKTRLKVRKTALEKKEGAKAIAEIKERNEKKKRSASMGN